MSTVEKKDIKIKNNKFFVIALIGAILIGVLIVLRIEFTEYMQFSNPGFAIKPGTVSKYLNMNPLEQEPEKNVAMYGFDAADILYEHKKSLFFDDDKKIQMDDSYPVYLNHGTSLQVVNSDAILYDEKFETVDTYKGLILNEGNAYNPSGNQADAGTYLFMELKNGYYMNLLPVTYEKKDSDKEIGSNSIINFTNDFFAFYEIENDELVYKYCVDIDGDMPVKINNKEYTYEELLILIGITKPHQNDDEDESTEESTSEYENSTMNETTDVVEEQTTEGETVTKPEEETEEPTQETTEKVTREPSSSTTNSDESGEESDEEETTDDGQTSPGVRPDEMRPDKIPGENSGGVSKPVVQEYVKPTVTIGEYVPGVYRISTVLEIVDPAKRIDKTKQVQFEVYKIDKKGRKQLAMRCYSGKTGPLDMGDGLIEPETKYSIVAYVTYYNEYDEKVVEEFPECIVTTKSRDTLGKIYLTHEPGVSYSNRIEIANFGYGEGSDEEAIYGINLAQGIKINISKNGEQVSSIKLNSTQIRRFKTDVKQVMTSASNLSPRTTYTYDIYVEDYFGNKLQVENTHGQITTSRNTPYASIKMLKNEIGNNIFAISIEDEDASAIVTNPDENGIYVVITEDSKGISSVGELDQAVWYYKLSASEYTYSEEDGLKVDELVLPAIDDLRLNKNYYVTVYCDYDLGNGQGIQKFQQIGRFNFTSASLASLGKVYLDCEVIGVTCNSATVKYTLNTEFTSPELLKLLEACKFTVKEKADDSVVSEFGFERDEKVTYDDGTEKYLYELFQAGEGITYTIENLKSVTEYYLQVMVKAYYLDYEEEIVVLMSNTQFKTLKKPTTVEIEDLLCAAGTLEFNVFVNDEDDAIIGNSGNTVVFNLYTKEGEFVKAVRIEKNQWHTLKFTQLDVTKDYVMRFIAVEYNEGYTNATFKSNQVLKTVDVSTMLEVTGNIKLQHIDEIYNNNTEYMAYTKSKIWVSGEQDLQYINNRFYLLIEKDGVKVSENEYLLEDKNLNGINYENTFREIVERGQHTYKYTLYVVAQNRQLVLDTLEFTTETTAEGFSTAFELIKLMKNDPEGKYIALNDIVLYSSQNYKFPNGTDAATRGESVSGTQVVTIFDGTIDFQGYTLTHYFENSGKQFVQNLGANAKIRDVVYDVYFDRDTSVYDMGVLCYRNYGTISDIIVNYRGGNITSNSYYGLLARFNASSGIIERFVVNNSPVGDMQPFTAHYSVGMLIASNDGIIRNGYATGEDIYLTPTTKSEARNCGGIVGSTNAIGQLYNVYSTVNFIQAEEAESGYSYSYYYGSVAGYVSGYFHNLYSVGESNPAEYKNVTNISNTDPKYGTQISPTVGQVVNGRYGNVYYWFDMSISESDSKTYDNKILKMIQLDTLYNRGWQSAILGEQFDTEYVETGFMPKVIMSNEMPYQENIPLPSRVKTTDLGISMASVDKYINNDEGSDSAEVTITFLNKQNYTITGITIENAVATLDLETAKSQDGYTTIKGTVRNPEKFQSTYKITEIAYLRNGKTIREKVDYDMNMEFYRHIASADDWYKYIVLNTNNGVVENVRLTKDIDFAKVATSKIRVTKTFNAKLDGNGKTLKNIDLQKDFAATNNTTIWNLFSAEIGASSEIYNLTIENYKGGGTNIKSGKTYVARYGSIFYTISGVIRDVHVKGVDIASYDRMGVFAATMKNGSELKNCSVSANPSGLNEVNLRYMQPTGAETIICLGGLAGYIDYTRITNCYITDLKVTADNMKSSQGVGGVVGYSSNSVIISVYAEGDINVRTSYIGGIVGQYYASGVSVVCIKDVVAKVDISSYINVMGGIVGMLNIPKDIVDSRNSTSGIASGWAVGNVYAYNPDSEYVSRTVGQVTAGKLMFYGCDSQLLNGQAGVERTENELICTTDIIALDDVKNDATNIYQNVLKITDKYKYSSEGYLPKLTYEGKNELLPNQKDIFIKDINESGLEVTNVTINENNRVITLRVFNPNHYLITDVGIENLDIRFVKYENGSYAESGIEDASDYTGDVTMLRVQYSGEQNHFQDSYVFESITYYNVKESCYSGISVNDAKKDTSNIKVQDTFARVGLTLFRKINSVEQWGMIATYPEYENYIITQDIDFGAYANYAAELKIGRLVGNGYTLKNIKLENKCLLDQVNSGISDLTFEGINITSNGTNNIGLIKINNGNMSNCNFKNVTINNTYKSSGTINEIGIITRQNAGKIADITMDNVTVKTLAKKGNYVGGLVAYYYGIGDIRNITANRVEVNGVNYVGAITGYIYVADTDGVNITKSNVTATGNYAGLLSGRIADNANAQSYKVSNITITGTPTYTEGVITGSDITVKGVAEVGAIAGRSYQGDCYKNGVEANSANTVKGVHVIGGGNNVGGAYGYHYNNSYKITVEDSLIEATASSSCSNVGGIIGYDTYGGGNVVGINNRIITKNFSNVGGLMGTKERSTPNNYYCEGTVIEASTTLSARSSNVGGAVGYASYSSAVGYGVINTKVLAPTMDNVGGVIGKLGVSISTNYTLSRSYALGEIDPAKAGTTEAALAKSEYQVVGYTNVGGLVGRLDGSTINYSYSNMNVVATGGSQAVAGGLTGYYNNSYTKVANTNIVTYSNAKLQYNYFVGSVSAVDGYAGGAFGASGLYNDYNLTGGRVKQQTGSNNEAAGNYTLSNLIFATNVKGGVVGAFAGDEGTTFVGRSNRVFDGVKLNGVAVAKLVDGNGSPLYKYWTWNNTANKDNWNKVNDTEIVMFKYTDLQETSGATKCSKASDFYSEMAWGTRWQSSKIRRNTYWRISLMGRTDILEVSGTCNGNYLPQIRSVNNETTYYTSDWNIRNQDIIGRLPIPVYVNTDGAMNQVNLDMSVVPESLGDANYETYAILYASDVDKINLEFSADMIGTRYYVLMTESGTIIDEGVIANRVYTYSYPFNENLVLSYGSEDTGFVSDTYLKERINRSTGVYGDYYYYFDSEGIVYGNESKAKTLEGRFVNVVNGKALDEEGYIWQMENGEFVKTSQRVENISLLDETTPLFISNYNGDMLYAYSKCTEIVTGTKSIFRDSQMLVKNNELYIIDSRLQNQKDGVLIFNKNGVQYMTILGKDGIVVDMYNKDVCLPEIDGNTVKNKTIVNMTNNINANAPYAIIKYANGGILGYNYMSGKVLFDKRVKEQVSLLEYAGEYYSENDVSMYANISDTYKQNLSLLQDIAEREDIDALLGTDFEGIQDSGAQIENPTNNSQSSGEQDKKPVGKPEQDKEEEDDEDVNDAVNNRTFLVVYDVEKEAYTVVYVNDYLVKADYKSENERVGVDNIAEVVKGKVNNATSTKADQTQQGIWLYVIAATLLIGGMIAFIPTVRKNQKYKRR